LRLETERGIISNGVNELKAVFAVRNFDGNRQYVEREGYIEGETPYGTPLEVTSEDSEVMVGSCMGFDLKRHGFFIFHADLSVTT
jgi:hypothetical protein